MLLFPPSPCRNRSFRTGWLYFSRGERRGLPDSQERTSAFFLIVKTVRYKDDDFGMNNLWRRVVSM